VSNWAVAGVGVIAYVGAFLVALGPALVVT
jgi:hypothetical protein